MSSIVDKITEKVKKMALKQIFLILSDLSDKNLVLTIEIGERFLIWDEGTRQRAEKMKNAIKEGQPAAKLARRTFSQVSKQCKRKIIENFFINAGIIGKQRQLKLKKKIGFYPPWFMVISPTARCNLHCIGCYAGEYTKEKELTTAEIDRILTEGKELGIYFVTISGGEPFLRKDLLKLFKKHNDIAFQVYTNGTLIDKKLAEQLAKLGNVAPAISVEGFQKETDDRRGQGVWKKIMTAMDNLKKAGVMFGFSATPSKLNNKSLTSDAFIDLMIAKGCSFGWFFQYVPIGKKPDVSLMSTPEQRNHLREKIAEWRQTKDIFIGDFWNDGPYVGGCIAGARPGGYFHINCQGDVEPCVFLQFSVDNIKNKKLIDVLQSDFFRTIREFQPYCQNSNLLTPCALIDNPWALREAVKKCHAHPSYDGGMAVIEDPEVIKFLDEYSRQMKEITDPIWETMRAKYPHWKERKCYQNWSK